jgi:NAD-dependent dihydropyrimidine dehydrogenase PreA subunit
MFSRPEDHHSPYLKIENNCIACEWCRFNCPVEGCFTFETLVANFHQEFCIECSRCIYVCPVDVIIPLRQPNPKHMTDGKTNVQDTA